MAIVEILSVLALKPLIEGARQAVPERTADAVVRFLSQRFADQTQRLQRALTRANERTWQAFEIALGGDTLMEQCQGKLRDGDRQNFRRPLEAFLASTPSAVGIAADPFFRRRGREQLRAAHQAGLLIGGQLDPRRLAELAGPFAVLGDSRQYLQAEWRAMGQLADELDQAGLGELAQLIRSEPTNQAPFLAQAARYFFQRTVVPDQALVRALDFARWDSPAPSGHAGFEQLERLFADHGRLLAEVLGMGGGLRADLLDLKAESQRLGKDHRALFDGVHAALERFRLSPREVRADNPVSLTSEEDRRLVRQIGEQYRALPVEQRRRLPALLNGLGLLQAAAGDLEAAQKDFETVATGLGSDALARAAALHNGYRVALARHRWDEALGLLKQALTLDPQRFTLFPLDRNEPERILGTDTQGVSFLCKNPFMNARVVVKALHKDGSDPGMDRLLAEAQTLKQVEHPAIIRFHDAAFADAVGHTRPFLVMEQFEGVSLEEYVKTHGRLTVGDILYLGRQIAEGLQAVHAKGVPHRDLKAANVLVRKVPPEPPRQDSKGRVRNVINERPPWLVKVINFDFARADAPPSSDVVGWARTCCLALFQTTEPQKKDLQSLPPALSDLLESCLTAKTTDFAEVLQRLPSVEGTRLPEEKKPTPVAPGTEKDAQFPWETACQQDTAEAYERFLDRHPTSPQAEDARRRAERKLRQLVLASPTDPGLRYRYLARRTEAGQRWDRWRALMGLWFAATLLGLVVWVIFAPLGALVASRFLNEWDGWFYLGVVLPIPAGLLTGLVGLLHFGIGDSKRFAELGPLPMTAYFAGPGKARAKYPF